MLSFNSTTKSKQLSRYAPLHNDLSDQQDDEAEKPVPHSQVLLPPTKFYAVIIGLLVALLFSNGILIWRNMDSNKGREALPYWGSDKKLLRPYHWVTEFSDENKTVTSPLWESLFPIGDGLVSLSDEWAASHNLPGSAKRYESSNSIYFVAAYHQLHCLVIIRSVLYHLKEGAELAVPFAHAIHCLDALRQSTMCHADDTILYTKDTHTYGEGQLRTCREWSALERWTNENRIDVKGILDDNRVSGDA
ncbi:hypothetical protein F4823DRAFT_586777 [Ustulina deusta]|nr:hypothetical protein F4823DRAFT_586777 [Ustulina deusta]